MKFNSKNPFLAIILSLLISACAEEVQLTIFDDAAISNEDQTTDWLAYERTQNERRFSPLDDINSNNVADLKVHWFMDLPNDVGLVSTPLVVNGILFEKGQKKPYQNLKV